jgi:predicted nuclease of predicted toxin-antitoxin system
MRFLADESCDFAVVRALRGAGHDVVAVVEVARGTGDRAVIARARDEGRVLLTEDKDFGQLVFAGGGDPTGVVLIRFPASARGELPAATLSVVERFADRLTASFIVLEPGRARIGTLPPSQEDK